MKSEKLGAVDRQAMAPRSTGGLGRATRPGAPPSPDGAEGPAKDTPVVAARRHNWLGWALALAILLSCALLIDPRQLGRALLAATPAELAGLLLLATTDRLLMGFKWGRLLRIVGVRTPMSQLVRIFYQANLSGVFLPSHVGGDLLRAWWAMQATGLRYPVFASLVVERVLGLIGAVNWALLGASVYAATFLPGPAWHWAGAGLAGALVANAGFACLLNERLHALVLAWLNRRRGSRPLRLLRGLYAACATFAGERRALAVNLGLTLIEQALQMALILAIALSIGVAVQPVALLAASTVYLLAVRVPIAPDGWGTGELAAIGAFGLVGVDATQAFTISLIAHTVPMLALSPGLVFLLGPRRQPPATMP